MRALALTGPGRSSVQDVEPPVAGPGEVVVDIHAASVNAADYKVRLGGGRYSLSRFPHILGRDFSGVVSTLGAGVTDFTVGDAVFGVTDQGIEGAYAEKIAIKAAIIAKKPDRLSHVEAAALGLTSLTALTAIEDTAHLKAGQTILIQGGAGGVAGFAVQLCKYLGATVITTAARVRVVDIFGLNLSDLLEGQKEAMHGDEVDTSIMMFLCPEMVSLDQAQDYMMSREQLRRYRRGWLTVPSGSAGSIGRPSLASAEKGKLLWDRIYSKISDRIFLAPAPSE